MKYAIKLIFFFIGLLIFSYGIAMAIQVKYLGISPWDVLNLALYERLGFTIGTWNIIVGFFLITCTLIINRKYINIGTFLNAVLVGIFVDFFLLFQLLPNSMNTYIDILILFFGILLMGIGGGMYSAAGIGAGPRDGLMLSISDLTGLSISRVRIFMECLVLVVGLTIGGPVFIFTFIYTFIQSPIYQKSYLGCKKWLAKYMYRFDEKKKFVS
ncbi:MULTISPECIES: YczE/YyaS/YitT family protein [Fictibacillus]|uniref:YczE/YyaS/YitT family protein n=1 Tax=Fictibacillus TaxID=1329200 RepID=UPI0011AAE18C|nr:MULTISPECIES: YitT family protein [Fictibacillus]MBH0167977.1 YitT family protein [Fictibacillus sp. 18YEL24]